MPDADLQIVLVLIALFAGVGITAIGPGGIFLTIALYALLPAPPPVIAGTVSVTFVAAGLVGSASYLKSGELARGENRSLAWLLGGVSVAGALLGSVLNPYLSKEAFGVLLGVAAIITGAIIVVKKRIGFSPRGTFDLASRGGRLAVGGLGLGIGISGALLGIGGPVLAVPALVLLGVPMLTAVAVAQVQSVFIATFASVGYAVQDAISWPLAALVGIPQLVGVLAGWAIAQRTRPERLELALGLVLAGVGLYLFF